MTHNSPGNLGFQNDHVVADRPTRKGLAYFEPSSYSHWNGERSRSFGRAKWKEKLVGLQNNRF
jgi:hypothetical protein